jgi:hypothetical protein
MGPARQHPVLVSQSQHPGAILTDWASGCLFVPASTRSGKKEYVVVRSLENAETSLHFMQLKASTASRTCPNPHAPLSLVHPLSPKLAYQELWCYSSSSRSPLLFFLQNSNALVSWQQTLQVFLEHKKQKKLLSPKEKTKVFPHHAHQLPPIFDSSIYGPLKGKLPSRSGDRSAEEQV